METIKDFARTLRQQATQSEQLLWGCLRKRRLLGLNFRRQQIIGPYIVDFCCFEKKVLIEIDGMAHDYPIRIQNDEDRQRYLENVGFRMIRFTAQEVEQNLEGVLATLSSYIEAYPPP
jgi:very-short-patch-repair endonuclease